MTCRGITMSTRKNLVAIKGLSEAKADKLIEASRKLDPSAGFMTASTCYTLRAREIGHISTGCLALDAILGGGMETKALTEIHGEFRTGKTQLCLTMCVTCQLPADGGGASGKVAFIDTEGSFRPERIRPIAVRYNLDPDAVLENIVVARAFTHEHQMGG